MVRARARARAGISDVGNIYQMLDVGYIHWTSDFRNIGVILS